MLLFSLYNIAMFNSMVSYYCIQHIFLRTVALKVQCVWSSMDKCAGCNFSSS